jgi:DNA-binding IscR family transcriptional regulator
MLTKRAKYGLKATICLARNYHEGAVIISDLSKQEYIPRKFLGKNSSAIKEQ